ncbi:hypothetical protein DIPPA_04724 [Diplonema papillatum]|nr:hypothetical protein DIPPA_04724 [Diplonema papillatum]
MRSPGRDDNEPFGNEASPLLSSYRGEPQRENAGEGLVPRNTPLRLQGRVPGLRPPDCGTGAGGGRLTGEFLGLSFGCCAGEFCREPDGSDRCRLCGDVRCGNVRGAPCFGDWLPDFGGEASACPEAGSWWSRIELNDCRLRLLALCPSPLASRCCWAEDRYAFSSSSHALYRSVSINRSIETAALLVKASDLSTRSTCWCFLRREGVALMLR